MPGLQHEPIHRRGARRYAAHAMLVVVLAAAMVGIAAPADSSGRPALGSRVPDGGHGHRADRRQRSGLMSARVRPRRPLVFGIYPGGAAGTVGPGRPDDPEDAGLRQAALSSCAAAIGRSCCTCTTRTRSRADATAVPAWLASQIAAYTAAGFQVELVLAYRPAAAAGDVAGFTDFVRARVRQLGANGRVTDLQVTNEANVAGAPDAADGAYPGARRALVRGVIAAKDEAAAAASGSCASASTGRTSAGRAERAFFSSLGATGGRAVRRRGRLGRARCLSRHVGPGARRHGDLAACGPRGDDRGHEDAARGPAAARSPVGAAAAARLRERVPDRPGPDRGDAGGP